MPGSVASGTPYIIARGLVHVCDSTHLDIIHTLLIEDNINISSHPTRGIQVL
jgi:hypothetical protein